MCSYNAVNGKPTCASPFLNHVLRQKFKFNGYITGDTGAVNDIYAAHKYVKTPAEAACKALRDGGCDMDSGSVYAEHLLEGVNAGYCSMEDTP